MNREKYLANIDKVLTRTLAEKSSSLGDKNAIRYSKELEEQGYILKIAFDVYKVDNDPYHDLWILQDIEGVPHLVRANEPRSENTASGDWSVISDHSRENVTLAYKTRPIARFSSASYGFSTEDIITFKEALLEKVSGDDEFVKAVFAEQPAEKRIALSNSFPELSKYI